MRDLIVTLIVFGGLPFIFSRPWLGILMWSWLGYMNPHRLAWGFAQSMPFAAIIGLATLFSLLISKEPKRLPVNGVVVTLILLNIWMLVTSILFLFSRICLAIGI